jgi:hypothetical protein
MNDKRMTATEVIESMDSLWKRIRNHFKPEKVEPQPDPNKDNGFWVADIPMTSYEPPVKREDDNGVE